METEMGGVPALAKGIALVLGTVIGVGSVGWFIVSIGRMITDNSFLIIGLLVCLTAPLLVKAIITIRRDIISSRDDRGAS